MAGRREWKTAAGARLVSAYAECVRAMHHLGAALRDLESEALWQNRDGEGRFVLLDSAANDVGQASSFLSAAMAHMEAAQLLALRGCANVPTAPLASVPHVHDADHAMGFALTRLQTARAYGRQVLRAMEAPFGHLWAAQFMGAGLPPAAGPNAVMEDEVRAAINQIRNVLAGC